MLAKWTWGINTWGGSSWRPQSGLQSREGGKGSRAAPSMALPQAWLFLLSKLWALGLLQVPMHGNPGAPHSLAYLMSTLVLAKMEDPGFQL